jgi:hypothetical protein
MRIAKNRPVQKPHTAPTCMGLLFLVERSCAPAPRSKCKILSLSGGVLRQYYTQCKSFVSSKNFYSRISGFQKIDLSMDIRYDIISGYPEIKMTKYTQTDKDLVHLLTTQGWTVEEISAELDMPAGTVKMFRRLTKKISADNEVSADIYNLEKIAALEGQVENLSLRISELEQLVQRISADIRPVLREREKRREEIYEDADPKPRLSLGKRP